MSTSPQLIVRQLAEIVMAQSELSQDEVYSIMAAREIPVALVDRTYKFTQIAWGRVLLGGFGIEFSSQYMILNEVGETGEFGLLKEEPFFIAANEVVSEYKKFDNFIRFASSSSEVNAVNAGLDAGAQVSDFLGAKTSPPTLFGPLYENELDAIQSSKNQEATAAKLGARKSKSWWRF